MEDVTEGDGTSQSSCLKYRKAVNDLVITVINDNGKPFSNSSVASIQKLLAGIERLIDEMPQIFVSYPLTPVDGVQNEEFDGGKISLLIPSSFTKWLTGKLLKLFCHSEIQSIHKLCQNSLISLFTLLCYKNPKSFVDLAKGLLHLMSDLANHANMVLDKQTEIPFEGNQFQLSPEALLACSEGPDEVKLKFDSNPLIVPTLEAVESLQLQLTELLCSLQHMILSHLRTYNIHIWNVICVQLKNGSLLLKAMSLSLAHHIIDENGVLTYDPVSNYFFACLESLLGFVFMGSHLQYSEEEKTGLELQFSKLLRSINLQVPNCVPRNRCLTFCLRHFLQAITSVLGLHGLYQINTVDMREAISDLLLGLLKAFHPINKEAIQHNYEALLQSLFSHFGKLERSSILINLICYTVAADDLLDVVVAANQKLTEKPCSSKVTGFSSEPVLNGSKLPLQKSKSTKIFSQLLECFKKLNHEVKNSLMVGNFDPAIFSGMCTVVSVIAKGFLLVTLQRNNVKYMTLNDQKLEKNVFISENDIDDLLIIWQKCLYSNNISSNVVEDVALCVMHVLEVQDTLPLTPEHYNSLCILILHPWAHLLETSRFGSEEFAAMANKCFKSNQNLVFTNTVKTVLLRCMALLPNSHTSNWKLYAMKSIFQNEDDHDLCSLMSKFPMHFYSLGVGSFPFYDELCKLIQQPRQLNAAKLLAVGFGKLCCVLSESACPVRIVKNGEHVPTVIIICSKCDKYPVDMESKSHFVSLPALQDILLRLIHHPDHEVRLSVMSCLEQWVAHFLFTQEILLACMDVLNDSDFNVRYKFSHGIKFLLRHLENSQTPGELVRLEDIFIERLKESVAKAKGNARSMETLLLAVGQIGQVVSSKNLLLVAIVILIESLWHEEILCSATSCIQLRNISKAKNMSLTALFRQFRQPLCKFLVETMIGKDSNSILNMVSKVCSVFTFPSIKTFLLHTLRYLLPPLVIKATPEAARLIRFITKTLDTHRPQLFMNNFKYIFSHLVCHCDKETLEKALEFVQVESNIQIGSLLRCDSQRIHNELLLHCSTHFDQVFNGLSMLASKDANYKGTTPITSKEAMADFLQTRLLGFLMFFDSRLLNMGISLDDKKLALKSLICIIKLMGQKHISCVRMKLMATLRMTLRFTDKEFVSICCNAWNAFVQNVELMALGPMLNQITATLLPLVEISPTDVAQVFNFLIVENKDGLSAYFHDLYFIPDIPEFKEVNAILKEYIENPSSQDDFKMLLTHSLKGMSNENVEVRVHAVRKLKHLLTSHQVSLQKCVTGKETVNPVISKLVCTLIASCREPDRRVQLGIAECLGEVGAIDPGRLETRQNHVKGQQLHIHHNVTEEDFAYDLLQELIRSFLAAEDSCIQDCSSYAIQELLQIYQCNNASTSAGSRLWDRFLPHEQEILSPFLESRYIISSSARAETLPKPIFGSPNCSTFKTWITSWVSELLSKVRSEDPPVFNSCSMIVKHDVNIALFLLPHVLVNVLHKATEDEQEEMLSEVKTVLMYKEHSVTLVSTDFHQLSVQTIFSLLDKLSYYSSELSSCPSSGSSDAQEMFQAVKTFLDSISLDLLAQVSYECHAYTRALMYIEKHLSANPSELQQKLGFLQKIYAALDESDGVSGASAMFQDEPDVSYQILAHEVTGQLQDAFSCYERAVKLEPNQLSHHEGLMKCLLSLDQPQTVLKYGTGLIESNNEWSREINSYRIEAAWRLANWDSLESFLEFEKEDESWGVSVGKTLLLAKQEKWEQFENQLSVARSQQMGPLCAAAMENSAYQRGQLQLIKLHMLTEIEWTAKIFLCIHENHQNIAASSDFLVQLATRRNQVQSSIRYQEPILNLQRVLLSLVRDKHPNLGTQIDQEVMRCWLQSAKLARKSGNQQRAYNCLLESIIPSSPDVFIEKAKWLWNKGDQELAMTVLQKGIQKHFPEPDKLKVHSSESNLKQKLLCAKAKLLLAKYSEESANIESSALICMFKEIVAINPEWEDSHFYMAKYYDRVLVTVEKLDKRAELIHTIIKYYGQSLIYGCKHVFHSMPRLLSLWFELGSQVAELKKTKTAAAALMNVMETRIRVLHSQVLKPFIDKIAPHLFLTAFPQLISRICHSHVEVALHLKIIIAKLLVEYPQQAMWLMTAVSKSSYPVRVERCREIFERAKAINPQLIKFIDDSTKFSDKLLELCNKPVEGVGSTLSMKQHFRILSRLFDRNFSEILLPLQSAMVPMLPTDPKLLMDHNPFPHNLVYIQGFQDTIEILASLQKPKKITIRGSDGNLYVMMCKPKDDLRKDCRLMEFNNLVNKYLKRDPEARRRQLYIRTYTVIPLNEECGLIEWIPDLMGLRFILIKIYKERGIFTTSKELHKLKPALADSIAKKLEIFKNKLLPRHPPVLKEWFLRTFPDPTVWYMARLAYCRTTAVMSMVGYILGLGDRHGENILLDSSSGDAVHVDFNCLFNKGETFEWPEKVPFRLTHNMVDAMGPLGYEGAFRKSSEVTLRAMRNQMEALMSVLKPFIHDPLVEWSKPAKTSRAHGNHLETGEINNEMALKHVNDIEQRLRGALTSKNKLQGLPLSIEGQVNYLIQQATDDNNLCQMYIGWAAYM